jgi:hypothetical protein
MFEIPENRVLDAHLAEARIYMFPKKSYWDAINQLKRSNQMSFKHKRNIRNQKIEYEKGLGLLLGP